MVAKVFAITSGKGGVGKTNVSVNLAVALKELNKKVAIFDADCGLANTDLLLGITPKYNLSDFIKGKKSLEQIKIKTPIGVDLIPAASGVRDLSQLSLKQTSSLITSFNSLGNKLDYLIVDTAAGIDDSVASFCRAADAVIVTILNEPTSIADAYALIKVFSKEHKISKFYLLVNQVKTKQEAINLYSQLESVVAKFLKVNLQFLGALPQSEDLRKAVASKTSVVSMKRNAPISKAFIALANLVDKLKIDKKPTGFIQFFLEDILKK